MRIAISDSLNLFHFGPQLEFDMLPIREGSTTFSNLNFGVNAGVKLNPFPRSIYRIWVGGGGSYGMYEGVSSLFPYHAGGTDITFKINEGLKVAGEVKVEYEYYGKDYTKFIPVTIHINNKTAMTWDDDRKAACFVTANNPLVYSYSRSLSGKIRNEAIPSLDKNFQIGMGLFESLNLYGLGYVVDPSSAYAYLPPPADVLVQHNKELKRFLLQEINTQVASIEQDIKTQGKSHILYNKMGVTYARYGFLDEAADWFDKVVAESDFYPSLINLGNIYYLKKNASEASKYYARALSVKPDSEKALIGLAMVSSELEDYDTANSALAALASVNPDTARNMAHLGTSGIARASSAQNREVDEWTE